MAEAQQHVADTMTEIVQGKELAHSEDTHKAAYDEPDISHESPERVDEAQQVLEDEGGGHSQEAQYVRDGATNRITELGTLFADFTAVIRAAAADVGPELQAFHDSMTQCLNGKVTELQHLRTQNEAIERKLLNIHTLFSQGQEGARSIIDGQAESSGSDHEIHEEATTADAREQDHTAEMDPAALQEPVDAAAVAGEATDDATTIDQSRKSRPCSPDLQLAPSPKSSTPDSSDSSKALKRARGGGDDDDDGGAGADQQAQAALSED